MLLKKLKHMVTKIKSYLGIKTSPTITLEVQVKSTKFTSTYPEDPLTYNEWTTHIYKLIHGKKRRRVNLKKKS